MPRLVQQVMLSSVGRVAWYFTMFLELGYVPTSTGRFQILHVEANIRKTKERKRPFSIMFIFVSVRKQTIILRKVLKTIQLPT